ncbi:hypothetical protein E4U55_002565 [Claviceps digitariae]|nr:hypothetical protein E4U55_002565 [Claviceps digitariae]
MPARRFPRLSPTLATPTSSSSIKRSDSPIYLSSSMIDSLELRARHYFLDELSAGAPYPGTPKLISSPDQLTEVQLKICFDILDACGKATDKDGTLKTTRADIEEFLYSVFKDCRWDAEEGLVWPELDFMVEADLVVGMLCTTPSLHSTFSACFDSSTCSAEITASVFYDCDPAMLKMEFTMLDPFTDELEAFCPLGRTDIRWLDAPWREALRKTLAEKLFGKLRCYNKDLAVFHARKLIHGWRKGSMCLGLDVREMGFMGKEAVSLILMALGETE